MARVARMGKTTTHRQIHTAALLFLLLAGCGQKEPAPKPEPQVEAVEERIPKRVERRSVSSPGRGMPPQTQVVVEATNAPVKKEMFAVPAPVPTAVPAPVVAPVIVSRPERKKEFSPRQSVSAPAVRQETGSFSEIEMGAIAWTQGDFAGAFNWFHQAAEQGNSEAQFNVGMMYASGEGVELDYDAALKYFEMALAQKNLNVEQIEMLAEMVREIHQVSIEEVKVASIRPVDTATIFKQTAEKVELSPEQSKAHGAMERSRLSGVMMQALSHGR